jgi:hypothetical protein
MGIGGAVAGLFAFFLGFPSAADVGMRHIERAQYVLPSPAYVQMQNTIS